jgi:hypothetical protein
MSSGGWGNIDPKALDDFWNWFEKMESWYAPIRNDEVVVDESVSHRSNARPD